MPTTDTRRRSRRLELRTPADERDLIDRAAAESGNDLTEFVLGSAINAAQRVLADRQSFTLDTSQRQAWDALNARPARDLPGVRKLLERPSPFTS